MDCTQRLINTDKSRKEIAKSTKLCSEVLDVVAEETQAGLKALAPSHSFAAVMKRNEVEKRRELAEETGAVMSEKDPTKNMQAFLKRKKSSAGKNTSSTSNYSSSVVSPSPKKKARRSERRKSTQNDECPYFPDNGKMFSPVELYNILLPLDGKKRVALVDHFSEKNWLRYEGQDYARCVRRFMQKSFENPEGIKSYWNNTGRPEVCDRKRFEEKFKSYLADNFGMMVGIDKVKTWLREIKKEKIVKAGGVPTEADLIVPESTARDYHAKIVYSDAPELVPHTAQTSSSAATVPRKPDNRHTMEKSLISAMTYALVVAATHVVPADDDNLPKKDECTEGAFEFVSLIREAYLGLKMRLLDPHEIINHDDTTDVIFEGVDLTRKNEVLVAHVESLPNRGTHGLYVETTENDEKTSKFRVKRTLAISASGERSQPFYTIAGLSESELPKDKCPGGFIVMIVHGMSPSAATDPFNEGIGYLCLMRSEKGAEQAKFTYWRKHVLYPFVRRLQEVHRNWDPSTPLPSSAQNVLWLDGAPEQIKATLKMQKSDAAINLTSCKSNAGRTGVEQACDTAKTFSVGKATAKKLTMKNMTSRLKTNLCAAFLTMLHLHGLELSTPKKNAYIDMLSIAPQVEAHAGQAGNIVHGWIKNGMIDSISMRTPDLRTMIRGTLRRLLTEEEYQLCLDNFVELLILLLKNGHLPDKEFLDRGFPPDTNYKGEAVPRLAGISQEHCQRAKILSHEHQVKLRADLVEEKMAIVRKKQEEANASINKTLADNQSCEEKIMDIVLVEWVPTPMPKDGLTLKHACDRNFHTCTIPELKPFLKARGEKIPSRKADLAKAAYEAREKVLTLQVTPDVLTTETEAEEPRQPVVISVPVTTHSEHSTFIAGHEFIFVVQKAFDPKDLHLRQDTIDIDTLNKETEALWKNMKYRLDYHMQQKVPEQKRKSWVFKFVRDNLGRASSAMIIMGHVNTKRVLTNNNKTCVLKNLGQYPKSFVPTDNLVGFEGCYLYYDTADGSFVRSGKVNGENRSFIARHKEHLKAAKSKELPSKFYKAYPSQAAPETQQMLQRGNFEDLTQYCGLGFSRQENIQALHQTDGSGIFVWSKEVLERIGAVNFSGAKDLEAKQLHMVGYLCELVYDLALAPDDNVSQSPGFETPLGIFGGSDD
jgi:hypothetical protein